MAPTCPSITWLIRFVHFVKSKRSVPPTVNHGKIGLAETLAASKAIVKTVQRQYFQEDLEALESGKPIKKDSKLSKLCPVLIDGAICVGGRLRHASVGDSKSASYRLVTYSSPS